ncbi:MAG: acetyl-CoA carboxylase biotin carboxyl carrier protein subunit [Solirubrobacterales bacterium]|jgi:acetyl-CoA carboxylase biotin carboxyl carrier protein|nr:acetyl-CoA carboxylase biotin carboxyl carrier protein subunit [Solirubrobacterales bacterium]
MSLSSKEIKEILAILEDSGWDEAEVSVGDVTLSVSKGAAGEAPRDDGSPPQPPETAPAPAPAASAVSPATVPAPDPQLNGHLISSPSVGVFWRAPEPGAPPFVEQGAEVQPGQALCIVEIMKLMQQVTADVAGVVTTIHTENGEQVEFGTPLFSIAPTSA